MNIVLFESLNKINSLSSSDRRYSHIINVLGKKEGDEFKCGVIASSKGCAKIIKVNGEELVFEYTPLQEKDESGIKLCVVLGAVRPICLKRVVRAAAECGVYKIILTLPRLAEKSYILSDFVKNDWKQTAIDGAEQSGETSLLRFEVIPNLKEALKKAKDDIMHAFGKDPEQIVLDNKTEFYKKDVPFLQNEKVSLPSVVAIGSERGWTDEERALFVESGYEPKKISSSILRTETAVITSLYPFLK